MVARAPFQSVSILREHFPLSSVIIVLEDVAPRKCICRNEHARIKYKRMSAAMSHGRHWLEQASQRRCDVYKVSMCIVIWVFCYGCMLSVSGCIVGV